MRNPFSHLAASEPKNNERKNLLLPLVFSIVALAVVLIVLQSVRSSFEAAASASGISSEPQISETSLSKLQGQESVENETEREQVVLDHYPEAGDLLGHLTVSGTTVDCDVYYGDSEAELSKGAGTFKGAKIPGEGGTILMGGHTGTYFRDFESVEIGDEVVFATDYGEYRYVVTNTQVASDTDTTAYDLDATEENLIMYTCYPFGIVNPTDLRFFVYCDLVSGPSLVPQQP